MNMPIEKLPGSDVTARHPVTLSTSLSSTLVPIQTWLAMAQDHGEIEQIVEIKSQAEAMRIYTMQKQLGKDAQLSAAEIVRRAERGIGVAIRRGQEAGKITTRDDTLRKGPEVPGVNFGTKRSPDEFFVGGRNITETYPAPAAREHVPAASTPWRLATPCARLLLRLAVAGSRRLPWRGSSWACRARALRLLPWLAVGGPALARLVWRCGLEPVAVSVGGALFAVALLRAHGKRAERTARGGSAASAAASPDGAARIVAGHRPVAAVLVSAAVRRVSS